MLAFWRMTPPALCLSNGNRSGFCCRASSLQSHENSDQINDRKSKKKKIVIIGSGWAGLGAAHHLCKQGFDITVLDGGNGFGGPDDVCMQGFWYPYQNIFSLVDELGIKPFTPWMKSAQYSEEGLEVEFPIFQDLSQLPTPLGTLFYSQFSRLPLVDRLTTLPLMAAVIDFDNTDTAWRKYDSITARELFKQFGCSERLYGDVIDPLLQVGLFAPAEQCSAAATLGILYYIILAHQKNFDVLWCRGTLREKIFVPWIDSMRSRGCEFLDGRRVTGLSYDEETGRISEVVCGKETYNADAVILAVGISTLQELIMNSAVLCTREEFLKVLNLAGIDVVIVKLRFDRKVIIPNASNACSGFGGSFAWTFFDLNQIYDEHKDDSVTVIQADFYHANELLPLNDEQVIAKAMSNLSKCIKDFNTATVIDQEIRRSPRSLTHFFPGSYKYMMRGSTSFPNLFMAGDWITTRHGSWSQERSYVTGLEAANRVVDYLEDGSFAKIIPVEEDEPHIEALRSLNRRLNELRTQIPLSDYFLQ
ncbi:Phytoene desaturase [Melia azedarach]|uniref:Phytoene desaturase n=1 Tax=Melia azedarach TaxID=155640 RepID=A0ACC1XXR9_MELAZ|nr:Phytoene desaturase [Melia azedarach]